MANFACSRHTRWNDCWSMSRNVGKPRFNMILAACFTYTILWFIYTYYLLAASQRHTASTVPIIDNVKLRALVELQSQSISNVSAWQYNVDYSAHRPNSIVQQYIDYYSEEPTVDVQLTDNGPISSNSTVQHSVDDKAHWTISNATIKHGVHYTALQPISNVIAKQRNGNSSVTDFAIQLKRYQRGRVVLDIETILEEQKDKWGDPTKQIGIGGGITSLGMANTSREAWLTGSAFFTSLLPSFCLTCSPRFHYHFYWAYDSVDTYFSDTNNIDQFTDMFYTTVDKRCSSDVRVSVKLVRCSHRGKPAWAQNDAVMEAYVDNMEYFYRINDDTLMVSSNWTEPLIKALAKYNQVGVVGPTHHGGNEEILTYDFTHKTHIDIFGCHYPRVLTDWFADDWITRVYKPWRSSKVMDVTLNHTMQFGKRYKVDSSKVSQVWRLIKKDKAVLESYLNFKKHPSPPPPGNNVIAVSLHGSHPDHTFGAIRNAQLAKLIFPGWKFVVCVPEARNSTPMDWLVPERVINKLVLLGANVFYVTSLSDHVISPELCSWLVADDPTVDIFMVRSVLHRLSARERTAVDAWLNSNHTFHCLRDHGSHRKHAIVSDLWSARRAALIKLLNTSVTSLLLHDQQLWTTQSASDGAVSLEQKLLWPAVKHDVLCHDSRSRDKWPNSVPFKDKTEEIHYVGQLYDAYGKILFGDEHTAISLLKKKNGRL